MNHKSQQQKGTNVKFSAESPQGDKVNFEFSIKLSKQIGQKLQQWQRWLLPAVGSVLVTIVTTIVPQLPMPQQPTPPTIAPGIDVQQPK